jgi:O-antigen/teichoic acid export membrane protein
MAIAPMILAMGTPLEIRRQTALGRGSEVLRTARIVATAALLPSFALAWALSATLFQNLDRNASVVTFVGLLLTPLSISWICDTAVLVSLEKYLKVFILQITQPIVYLMMVGVLWVSDNATVASVLAAMIAGNIATFLLGLVTARVSLRGTRVPFFGLLRSGAKYLGSSVADAANNRVDQLILLPLVGPYQAGLYSVAATIGLAPIAVGQALAAANYPRMARALPSNRIDIAAGGMRAALIPSLVSALVVISSSPLIIPLVFGQEFAPSVPLLQIVGMGTFFAILAYVASMLLAAEGKAYTMTMCQVAGLIVGLVGLFLLGPTLGAAGAAIASTMSYICLSVVTVAFLRLPLKSLLLRKSDLKASYQTLFRARS